MCRERVIRGGIHVAFVAAVSLGIGLPSKPLFAAQMRYFDIPAGPAESAVKQFGLQAGMSVIYGRHSLDHFRTQAIKGKYEPIEALRLLLDDSGLDFIRTTQHLIDVRPDRVRTVSAPGDPNLPVVEIAARGSSSLLDRPAGVIVRTVNGEELSRQGFTTVPDWARTLTQNQGIGANEATGYYGVALSNVAYGSGLNLYGIGQRATLILVNGQRLAPSGSEGSFTDIGNIPLSAVDRIELISDGASTIYGADAAGGIVNFVLRGNYSPPVTTLSVAPPGPLSENDFSQSFSKSGDQWRVVGAFELYSRNSLPASDRSLATSNLTPWGGTNFDTPYGNPGSILDTNGQLWGIPPGQDEKHLTSSDLLKQPNAYDIYAGTWMLPQQRRINGLMSGSYDLSADTKITLNGLFNSRWVKAQVPPLTTVLLVPNTNPFYVNPVANDTSPVQVLYGFGNDLGNIIERGTVRSGQATFGIKQQLNGDWSIEGSAGYTFENERKTQDNLVDFGKLAEALASADPGTAFDPFGGESDITRQTRAAAIRASGSEVVKSAFTLAGLKAVGSVRLLPAGRATFTAGYDFRKQTFFSAVTPIFSTMAPLSNTDRHRTLNALYLQSSVPVMSGQLMQGPSYELKLAAGLRYEHFNDVGAASLPSLGFSFDTTSGVSLFGTWARMFRPPNLPDLDETNNYAEVLPLPDSHSPAGYTNALIWGGKNANLRPERTRSWMAGIKYSPPADPMFTVDLQYFNIASFNQILPPQLLPLTLFTDPQFGYLSYLYTREVDSATVANICSHVLFFGTPGVCQGSNVGAIVDLRLRSAETVKTDGVDLKLLRRWDTAAGEWSANLQATYILHFCETQAPGTDFISYRNTPHNPPALRLRSVFRWENQWLSVSPALNLQGSYTDTSSNPDRPVGAWTTWDLVVAYKPYSLDELIGGNTTVSLRGLNVFNKQPPFLNNNVSFVGFDPENADLLGRRISLRLEHEW